MEETAPPDVKEPKESVPEEPPPDKKEEAKPLASIRDVFSFGEGRKKRICLVLGFACSFVSGCVFPVMAFLFARSFQDLVGSVSDDNFLAQVRELAYSFMVLGAVAFAAMSGQATLLETSAGVMTHTLKITWFDALLRQDLAYYDIKDVSGTASIISQNGAKYKKYVRLYTIIVLPIVLSLTTSFVLRPTGD
jgi:ATP-binding cassette subfamily B (MDR/TAP) protein 1